MKFKKGKADISFIIIIILLLIIIIGGGYYLGIFEKLFSTEIPMSAITTTTTLPGNIQQTNCPVGPKLVVTAVDAITNKLVGVASLHSFTINGEQTKPALTGSEVLVSANAKVNAIINSTSRNISAEGAGNGKLISTSNLYCNQILNNVDSSGWNKEDGSAGEKGTIPCKASINIDVPIVPFITDSSFASTNVLRDSSAKVISATANVTFDANSRASFSWTFDPPDNTGLCNAGNPILSCIVTTTDVTLVEASVSRGILSTANTPSFVESIKGTGQQVYSWEWSQNFKDNLNPATVVILLTSGSTDPSSASAQSICFWNDQDYFPDNTDNTIKVGPTDVNKFNIGILANIVNTTLYYV